MTTPGVASPPPATGNQATRMIRADLDVRAFHRWAGSRGMISQNVFDPGFAMHCLLTESFGDKAPKPFRLIIPRDLGRWNQERCGTLYGYSEWDADELRDAAQTFACPLQAKALPSSSIDSKQMPTSWQAGQRLGFETLIRPVVRCARGAGSDKGNERDAFQAEADPQHHSKGFRNAAERRQDGDQGVMLRTREDVYRDWLSDRLGQSGACLEDAHLVAFQRVRAVRKLRKPAVEGPDAVMRGTLVVADPGTFASLVAKGIGRHRAYGYGMVLLRPALNSAHS